MPIKNSSSHKNDKLRGAKKVEDYPANITQERNINVFNRGWSDSILNYRKEERLRKMKQKIDNALMNKRIKSLKDYEVEDLAYYFARGLLRKQYERTNKIYLNEKWNYVGTIKYGNNKMNFLKDNEGNRHIVVSGGKHNVNFNIENRAKFALSILKYLGLKARERKGRGGYDVYIGKN